MSDATKQYTELVQQSQDAVLAAVENWTKTVQSAFGDLPTGPSQIDPSQVVDQVFDFTEKVLEVQRDIAKKLITTSAAAAPTATPAGAKATAAKKV